MTEDIKRVRAHYSALRDLVMEKSGGWDDAATRAQVEASCEAAMAELDDAECHTRLRAVMQQARELYSQREHLVWARATMSGADYLRLQILINLEALNTRLFFLETSRAKAARSLPIG